MPDMPGMVRRLGRESTARRLGFARLGRLESWMLESGMHNSDRHHSRSALTQRVCPRGPRLPLERSIQAVWRGLCPGTSVRR